MSYTSGSHTVFHHRYHIVWITKYRYNVLEGALRERIRTIIRQVCKELGVQIVSGVLSREHVHMFVEIPPHIAVSDFVRRVKGRSSQSSRMAHVEPARRAAKYHNHSAAAQMPRTEPCRERLAVPARQLAVEPYLQILRRHPRSLLLRVEQARRYALENHVHGPARLGASVLVTETWYKWLTIAVLKGFWRSHEPSLIKVRVLRVRRPEIWPMSRPPGVAKLLEKRRDRGCRRACSFTIR